MNRNSTPYSQLKIFCHPEVLAHLERGERCNPVYIRMKPTNRCNHNCSYCHYKHSYLDLDEFDPNDEIPHDKMLEIIDDLADLHLKAITFSGGGEPLLYPYIEETMERMLGCGIDISAITNGSLLNGERAKLLGKGKWVRISVESINDEEYTSIRGIKKGSFDALCDNLANFASIKDNSCELGINVVVNKENHNQVIQMAKLMKDLGANHVKFAPLCTNDTWGYHKDFKDEVTRQLGEAQEQFGDDRFKIIDLYTGDFDNSVIFERQYAKCPMKEFICVIAANQKVYYCQDKAYLSDGAVGDMHNQSFKELWLSDTTTELFRKFDAMKICGQHCVHDSRNEMINSFLAMDRNHVNFI